MNNGVEKGVFKRKIPEFNNKFQFPKRYASHALLSNTKLPTLKLKTTIYFAAFSLT